MGTFQARMGVFLGSFWRTLERFWGQHWVLVIKISMMLENLSLDLLGDFRRSLSQHLG